MSHYLFFPIFSFFFIQSWSGFFLINKWLCLLRDFFRNRRNILKRYIKSQILNLAKRKKSYESQCLSLSIDNPIAPELGKNKMLCSDYLRIYYLEQRSATQMFPWIYNFCQARLHIPQN